MNIISISFILLFFSCFVYFKENPNLLECDILEASTIPQPEINRYTLQAFTGYPIKTVLTKDSLDVDIDWKLIMMVKNSFCTLKKENKDIGSSGNLHVSINIYKKISLIDFIFIIPPIFPFFPILQDEIYVMEISGEINGKLKKTSRIELFHGDTMINIFYRPILEMFRNDKMRERFIYESIAEYFKENRTSLK